MPWQPARALRDVTGGIFPESFHSPGAHCDKCSCRNNLLLLLLLERGKPHVVCGCLADKPPRLYETCRDFPSWG